jgi:hypothetical protein
LTRAELDRAQALVDAATPGPWGTPKMRDMAPFIAESLTLVSDLLAEVRKLRRGLAQALVILDKLSDGESREEAMASLGLASWAEVEEEARG